MSVKNNVFVKEWIAMVPYWEAGLVDLGWAMAQNSLTVQSKVQPSVYIWVSLVCLCAGGTAELPATLESSYAQDTTTWSDYKYNIYILFNW